MPSGHVGFAVSLPTTLCCTNVQFNKGDYMPSGITHLNSFFYLKHEIFGCTTKDVEVLPE